MPIKKSKKTAIALAILSPLVLLAVFAGGEPEADDDLGAVAFPDDRQVQRIIDEQNRYLREHGEYLQIGNNKVARPGRYQQPPKAFEDTVLTNDIKINVHETSRGWEWTLIIEDGDQMYVGHYSATGTYSKSIINKPIPDTL